MNPDNENPVGSKNDYVLDDDELEEVYRLRSRRLESTQSQTHEHQPSEFCADENHHWVEDTCSRCGRVQDVLDDRLNPFSDDLPRLSEGQSQRTGTTHIREQSSGDLPRILPNKAVQVSRHLEKMHQCINNFESRLDDNPDNLISLGNWRIERIDDEDNQEFIERARVIYENHLYKYPQDHPEANFTKTEIRKIRNISNLVNLPDNEFTKARANEWRKAAHVEEWFEEGVLNAITLESVAVEQGLPPRALETLNGQRSVIPKHERIGLEFYMFTYAERVEAGKYPIRLDEFVKNTNMSKEVVKQFFGTEPLPIRPHCSTPLMTIRTNSSSQYHQEGWAYPFIETITNENFRPSLTPIQGHPPPTRLDEMGTMRYFVDYEKESEEIEGAGVCGLRQFSLLLRLSHIPFMLLAAQDLFHKEVQRFPQRCTHILSQTMDECWWLARDDAWGMYKLWWTEVVSVHPEWEENVLELPGRHQ